jgi:uridine kinase
MKIIDDLEKKYDIALRKILFNKWFLMILGTKIVCSALFASDFLIKGFAAFVNYYVTSGFDNPYEFFFQRNYPEAFPYPPMMLWIFSVVRIIAYPFLSTDWSSVGFGHLLLMRVPILLADILIYVVLCKWLETKEKMVLILYWASPILFFINYFHGQLDVMPMAILFASLVLLFNKKTFWSVLMLGIGIATKTHLMALVPFYFIFLLINRYPIKKVISYTIIPVLTFVILMLPFLFSEGFIKSVFGTEEGAKLFLVNIPYWHEGLSLIVAPAAVLILFFNFVSYKKLNKDAFLLILGLLFTIFIVFVPPMPGWFYWSIPFFVYFFAKYKETPKFSFWFLNVAFLLYFVLSKDSYFFSSLQLVAPNIASLNLPYEILLNLGFNMPLIINIIFTLLIAAIIMNAVWIYRMGVRSNLEYKIIDKPLIIGIGGDSGSGKNTLANLLIELFGKKNSICIEGDDAHKWERHDKQWEKFTHLDPKSNKLHQDLNQTKDLIHGESVKRSYYDHQTGTFTLPKNIEPNKIVLYIGLHPFYLSKMRSIFDIKIFVEPDESLRRYWKIKRDRTKRGRTEEEILKQIKEREEDAKKYIQPQRKFADIIFTLAPKEENANLDRSSLKLKIFFDNSIDIDLLLKQLSQEKELNIEHWYEEDLSRQCLEFSGAISKEKINKISYALIPNLEELTFGSPIWCDDLEGLRQLFILYYYSETQKILK